ncbi:MAG TPA: hypothetical protein VJU34_11465 [Phenylobacterium sp.]|nr:hypothetical protein [Phenylobacterium sp.]
MAEKPQPARCRQTPPRPKTPDELGQVTCVRYSVAVARKICARLAKGESWSRIANTEGMPSYSALYAWQKRRPEFAEAVAQAREIGADYCADKALEVAAAATKDTVQQDRLFVQTLMKHAALKAPKRWGGKGEAKEKPQTVEVVFRVRHFEKAIGPDGKAFVREIKPEGEA